MSHGDTSTAFRGAFTGMSAAIAEVAMPSNPAAIDTISLFIVHPSLENRPPEGVVQTPDQHDSCDTPNTAQLSSPLVETISTRVPGIKPKRAASADFLGESRGLAWKESECCKTTTFLVSL
jgi:hypothetical protein